jgi:hypothetical protein
MIPQNVILFRFAGYGPELSRGLAARTSDGRLVLSDAAANPGTSITNAIETATDTALKLVGLPQSSEILQYTPEDPVVPDSVWRVHFDEGGTRWEQVTSPDPVLLAAMSALRTAAGLDETASAA